MRRRRRAAASLDIAARMPLMFKVNYRPHARFAPPRLIKQPCHGATDLS